MLDNLTDTQLIEKTLADAGASPEELAFAERLQAAIEELDRVTQSLQRTQALLDQVEAADGQDA